MIFGCVVSFQSKKKKIPDLSLPPCIPLNVNVGTLLVGFGSDKLMRIRAGQDPYPQDCLFPNYEVRTHAFRDKFPACLLHVGRQDDQELHQEFILAAKGQSPFILD